MTVRKKYHLIIFAWFLAGSIFVLLSLYVHESFIIVLIAFAIFLGSYSLALKCPNCGKSVLRNTVDFFGMKMNMVTARITETCQKCGIKIE